MGSITATKIELSLATDLKEISNEYRAALIAFDEQARKLKELKGQLSSKRQNAIGMSAKFGAQAKELGIDPTSNKDYSELERLMDSPTLASPLYKSA